MIIKVVEGEQLPTMCYRFPDDTTFEKDIPFHGWIRIISNGRTWWFNSAYIVAILPDSVDGKELSNVKRAA